MASTVFTHNKCGATETSCVHDIVSWGEHCCYGNAPVDFLCIVELQIILYFCQQYIVLYLLSYSNSPISCVINNVNIVELHVALNSINIESVAIEMHQWSV